MELGMIGLGRMGANMAQRLQRAGVAVTGFDPGEQARAQVADWVWLRVWARAWVRAWVRLLSSASSVPFLSNFSLAYALRQFYSKELLLLSFLAEFAHNNCIYQTFFVEYIHGIESEECGMKKLL